MLLLYWACQNVLFIFESPAISSEFVPVHSFSIKELMSSIHFVVVAMN